MDIRTCGEPELDALNDRAKVWREQHSPKIRTELKTSRHTAAGQAPAKASSSGFLMVPPPSEAQIEGFDLPVWHSEDLDFKTLRIMIHRLKGSHSGEHPLQQDESKAVKA